MGQIAARPSPHPGQRLVTPSRGTPAAAVRPMRNELTPPSSPPMTGTGYVAICPGSLSAKEASPVKIGTENYDAELVLRDPARLVISVSSLGYAGKPRYHQFWKAIEQTGASALFIADRKSAWYNHADTDAFLSRIGQLCQGFDHVGIMGDSMGGSGAILLSNHVPHADRVLAFAPQYSLGQPFINFDRRYSDRAARLPAIHYDNYAQTPIRGRCLLLYGNTVWQDQLHRTMFEAAGFKTLTVEDAPHAVAIHLRKMMRNGRSYLQDLIDRFADFDKRFSHEEIRTLLAPLVSGRAPLSSGLVMEEAEQRPAVNAGARVPPGAIELTGTADQSSHSRWSRGRTAQQDAQLALASDAMAHPYAFHTAMEDNPWWSLSLTGKAAVRAIRLVNRTDSDQARMRADRLCIDTRPSSGSDWQVQFLGMSRGLWGGAGGDSFLWVPPEPVVASDVRIRLPQKTMLHMRKITVYGTYL